MWGCHDLTFKGFEWPCAAPLLGSFLRQAQAWLKASDNQGWCSLFFQRLFLRFLCFIGGRSETVSNREWEGEEIKQEFSPKRRVLLPPQPARLCSHGQALPLQAGGLQLIQWVWAARLIPLRGSKPRGAPLTRAVWPRWPEEWWTQGKIKTEKIKLSG